MTPIVGVDIAIQANSSPWNIGKGCVIAPSGPPLGGFVDGDMVTDTSNERRKKGTREYFCPHVRTIFDYDCDNERKFVPVEVSAIR